MESLKDKVAIVGMGCCNFGNNWSKSSEDMIIEAAYEAFEDAGVESKDIQAAWMGTLRSAMMGIRLARPLKLENIPVTRVENGCGTGMDALRNAAFAIAAGAYDLVLVVGYEKLKDLGYNIVPSGDTFLMEYGRSSPGEYALAATTYFHKFGIGKDTLAKVAVKNHHNGSLHPKAHFQRDVTFEQVMSAPIIAWPLGLFDCCPRTDGAAAAIICPKKDANKFRDDYVLIKGMGVAAGTGMNRVRQDYDFIHFDENIAASKQSYIEAGINDPFKEISMAEVHDCFTINELFAYEDLGFCAKGQAKEYIDNGVFTLEGSLPVNTDGGLKSFGHPQGASGLRMIYEIYKQLQGKADQRQIKDPQLGLAHNIGGTPAIGGVATVMIVGH